jgi:hypothetical protein
MKRRNLLKSVGSVPLLPTLSVPTVSDSVNYEYLDSLFSSEYMIGKNPNGTLGKTYSATYEDAKQQYTIQYRVYSDQQSVVDVYDNTETACIYKHYRYTPQNHYEAWTLAEIGRKQGLEPIKSALSKLDLNYEEKVKV